jgi:hypothetical protein
MDYRLPRLVTVLLLVLLRLVYRLTNSVQQATQNFYTSLAMVAGGLPVSSEGINMATDNQALNAAWDGHDSCPI